MCHQKCLDYGSKYLSREEVSGKRIVEVGAQDVNGSLRDIVDSRQPAEYVGVDIDEGPGVDVICNVYELADRFGKESFDVVISTEMVEHVDDWRAAFSQLKTVLKPGGLVLITTRSKGFPYHGYPSDFWRFEVEDMHDIFSDMEVINVEADDPANPGVFVVARKPENFQEKDLNDIALYSMITRSRTKNVTPADMLRFKLTYVGVWLGNFNRKLTNFRARVINSFKYRMKKLFNG